MEPTADNEAELVAAALAGDREAFGQLYDRHGRMVRAVVLAVSGDWSAVGHYTQIVWPTTRRVGCATASNRANDYLVCRYWPAGNVVGTVMR